MNNTALLIIDVQKAIDGYSDQERNNPEAEANMARLISQWRTMQWPVVHIRHSSKFTDSPYHESLPSYAFKDQVAPLDGEIVITKRENCAFIHTDLEQYLKQLNVTRLLVCGVLTNNSVDATVRVAAGLGFDVIVPSDATAAFAMQSLNGKHYGADDVHWLFLTNLDSEYCEVSTTEQILQTLREGT